METRVRASGAPTTQLARVLGGLNGNGKRIEAKTAKFLRC